MKKKVIISCAVTGAIHTPSMSEHLPVTADEVIEHSLEVRPFCIFMQGMK